MKPKITSSNGLDGISIGTTTLSKVDGAEGRLTIAGYDVEDLAGTRTFEEVVLLLFHGTLPDAEKVTDFVRQLSAQRIAMFEKLDVFNSALSLSDPLDSLRACMAVMSDNETFEETACLVLAAIPLFIGAWLGKKSGRPVPEPQSNQATAEALLYFIDAPDQSSELVHALNAYLLTVSDHGMNASTFTARVIASTQSDIMSSVTGAIGALKGPLHGGAPGPVLLMLDEILHSGDPEAWIRAKLNSGERIMGMGHRIYRVRDPRAAVFEKVLNTLPPRFLKNDRLKLAREVEKEAERQLTLLKPDRPLKANVEFYTAVLLETCGIPGALFTAVFAAGRAAGWLAHIKEQKLTGRLIRPSVDYVGVLPGGRY